MVSNIHALLTIFIALFLYSEAKPTFSWLSKGQGLQLHKLRIHHKPYGQTLETTTTKRYIKRRKEKADPTPAVSFQKSSPLKTVEVTPATIEKQKTKNFFGINHEHQAFKPSKYDKNCFFSPVNCVVYRSKVNGANVILRRVES